MTAAAAAAVDCAVVPTGSANLASVLAGLRRAGARPEPTLAAQRVAEAPLVVLPGVGSFGHARRALDDAGLAPVLQARIAEGRALLAICVGMQVLFDASEESPGEAGLGVLPGTVRRFAGGRGPDGAAVRIPQMGWNAVAVEAGVAGVDRPGVLRDAGDGHAYFANSYRVAAGDLAGPPVALAASTHGGERFVAAVERGGLLACQCHPELSGAWGRRLLAAWVARAGATATRDDGRALRC